MACTYCDSSAYMQAPSMSVLQTWVAHGSLSSRRPLDQIPSGDPSKSPPWGWISCRSVQAFPMPLSCCYNSATHNSFCIGPGKSSNPISIIWLSPRWQLGI